VQRTRVLIVDDSALVRRMLTDILAGNPAFEVVAAVTNAEQALARLESGKLDVITLDIEMPGMNGIALLEEIRKRAPRLPVVMFSSLTQRGAITTLEALARGATDYATKPSGGKTREESIEHVQRELVPKLLALGQRASVPLSVALPRTQPRSAPEGNRKIEAVAIGCSTGGPNALSTLFSGLPANLPVPILIVQHMPPIFTKSLAERLNAIGGPAVREASEGDLLEPGVALIAPGGFHMKVVLRGRVASIALDRGPLVNSCRPAVDNLFNSVAETHAGGTLAVIMTGMGSDGLHGCEAIRAKGGQVIVQDEASSVVWGMPGFVAKAGLADAVLPLSAISSEVLVRTSRGRRHVSFSTTMERVNAR
jgi:two-component system, chemotaxis family, protein-glutamate methylesterase/glutaminase